MHIHHSLASNLTLAACLAGHASAQDVRVATYNCFLNRSEAGALIADLSSTDNAQARAVAEVLQRNRPDVVLLNEFDYDEAGLAIQLFQDNYLSLAQNGAEPIDYPHVFLAPSNTGIPSGLDLDNDGVIESTPGSVGYGNDAFGFGFFEGQFAQVLLSRHPIDRDAARTFQSFLWKDMPAALLPDDPATAMAADWFSPEEQNAVRLSSKSHWDVPVLIDGQPLHVLCAHPTPPIFDGPEDRNGRRNFDEIRFWADYVAPGFGFYIYDDEGRTGGLAPGSDFVILGDYNADPVDGDGVPGAIQQLLHSPLITDPFPGSRGGLTAAIDQGAENLGQAGNPTLDTADFTDSSPFFTPSGNLRVDYALLSKSLSVAGAGVFWPAPYEPFFDLVGAGDPLDGNAVVSSDHRLVYVDVSFEPITEPDGLELEGLKIDFLGEVTLPTGLTFEGTEVGGLSAIVYDRSADLWLALSDDRSFVNDARMYALTLDVANGGFTPEDLELRAVIPLQQGGVPFAPASIDPEGLALSLDGRLYLSSEGEANAALDPFVDRFGVAGAQISALPVPTKFLTGLPDFGIRNNLAFESLTLSPGDRRLTVATENALFQDGPSAALGVATSCRVLTYDTLTGQAQREYVYVADPVIDPPKPAGSFATNGLVELLSIGRSEYLALERSFSVGVGNNIRLYGTTLASADSVGQFESLSDAPGILNPMPKALILDFDDLGLLLDNCEGMAFGPRLADGRQTLIVVSDNNFNPTQFTQFLAFAVSNR